MTTSEHDIAQHAEGAIETALSIGKLASLPDIVFKINNILDSEDCTSKKVAALIELDPALSSKLLKIANSSLYGFAGEISNIERAVNLVDTKEIRDLVYSVYTVKAFEGIPNELIDMECFWRHSIYSALIARALSDKYGLFRNASVFTAGLLHDIGQLALYHHFPDESRQALEHSVDVNHGMSPHLSESEVLGFNHSQVGYELAKLWNFPDALTECIAFHHGPFEQFDELKLVHLIHVANCITVLAEIEETDLDSGPEIDPQVLDFFDLSPESIQELIEPVIAEGEVLLKEFIG